MALTLSLELRRIIPRWRDSAVALATGELHSLPTRKPPKVRGIDLYGDKRDNWIAERSLEAAAELVSSALSQGRFEDAVAAAEFILEQPAAAKPTVVAIAKDVLQRADTAHGFGFASPPPELADRMALRARIHSLRMLLNDEPRNALMFADLSRTYIRLGQVDSSAKAIGQALRLAPDNRFILRAASRLFVHLHEPDRAHSLLMTSPTTRRDPWLLAAEIAIATVEGKSPLLARAARDALATNAYPPRHLSELASAVATIELGAGASRKARKLFERSLDSPTDNALAQAAWALRWLPNLHVEEALNVTPRAYEARTLHFYETLEWRAAVSAADSWLDDEAFSSRPAEIGSYVAAVGLEDYLLAERFARRGLVANPNDSILLNNLAFALASRGNPQEAWVVLRKVPRPDRDAGVEAALLATEGLIDFRMGDSEKGSLHYLAAIKNATEAKLDRVRALAGVYFARELIGSGRVGATEALGIAEEASRNLTSPDVRWLLDSLRAKVNRPPRI